MQYKAIIFDFNGVIIDDEEIHCELFQEVLKKQGIILTKEDYWNTYLGFDDKGLIEALYKRDHKDLSEDLKENLIEEKNNLYFPALKKNLRLFKGVEVFIESFPEGVTIGIVSGALKSEIEYVLDQTDLACYFDFIIAADDTDYGKPDPEGYLKALKILSNDHDIESHEVLVIEDSISGIQAAKEAGIKVVALTHTYPQQALEEADVICHNFDELKYMLNL